MFYATIIACWMGVGCIFGQSPETYNENTCIGAEEEMMQLIIQMGPPVVWEFACVDEAGLEAIKKENEVK